MIVLKNIKKMSKIPTAEECFNNFVDFEICPLKEYTTEELINDIKKAMIEFAKLHVEAALKEASEKAEWKGHTLAAVEICDYSILDAYPLENIK